MSKRNKDIKTNGFYKFNPSLSCQKVKNLKNCLNISQPAQTTKHKDINKTLELDRTLNLS